MAQKVNIILVDDLDGSEATQTVAFGLDGSDYEIDLNDTHADALREALSQYVGMGRKVGRGKGRSTNKAAASSTSGADKTAIREWAKANGHEVSDRGRIPAAVEEAYAAAQQGGGTKGRSNRRRTAEVSEDGTVKAS